MLPPKQRFSSRVENYVKYRPHYPAQIIDVLTGEIGLLETWLVADVGSGTGISSEIFLRNGNRVYGIEPNKEMREAGEEYLREYPGFISIAGSAEDTTLPDRSIDLIVAGQAFHWFDRNASKAEFKRILKPGGCIVLFWNTRIAKGTPFLEGYEKLLNDFCPDYQFVDHRRIDYAVLTDYFAPLLYREIKLTNEQRFDYESLQGRLLSSSYAPLAPHPNYEPMIAELKRIFSNCENDGKVTFAYITNIFMSRNL